MKVEQKINKKNQLKKIIQTNKKKRNKLRKKVQKQSETIEKKIDLSYLFYSSRQSAFNQPRYTNVLKIEISLISCHMTPPFYSKTLN